MKSYKTGDIYYSIGFSPKMFRFYVQTYEWDDTSKNRTHQKLDICYDTLEDAHIIAMRLNDVLKGVDYQVHQTDRN